MPSIQSILPALLDTYAGAASEAFTPGTAPVTIKNRYYKWRPRDFNSLAVPATSTPSAGTQTATVTAIQDMFAANVPCEFEGGGGSFYAVDSTISPSDFSASGSIGSKQVHFNDTEIKATGSLTNYLAARDQSAAMNVIGSGTGSDGSNLPAPETTRVLFDVTNCEYNSYMGKLTIHGGNLDIAGLACANSQLVGSSGGTGSTWGQLVIKNCKWGIFGTPRYGLSRVNYNGVLVGNIFQRLRIADCDIPILAGGNTIDDAFIGELNIIQKNTPGSRSYISTCALVCGTIYVNGPDTSTYGFDIQNTHLMFGTIYAEEDFAAVIYARAKSWVEGACKVGAGANTNIALAFVYNDDVSGGGLITVHERTSASTVPAMVLLKAKTSGARNYHVMGPTSESETVPFAMQAGTGTLATNDRLTSFLSNGAATWTVGGTSAAPTLTRASGI